MNDVVTLVIQHHVQPAQVPEYEAWLRETSQEAMLFPGHMGVNIVRPRAPASTYTIVLRFDSHQHLLDWMESPTRRKLVERAAPYLMADEELEIQTGLEFWFTPPAHTPLRARPYKQFLITLSAIYPLTLLIPWLLGPLLQAEPLRLWPAAGGLFVVVVIVYLMVYVIMPRYSRLVAKWLFD